VTEKQLPWLWQFCTYDRYPDGAPRYLATMRVWREPGLWVVRLEDHELGKQCTACCERLAGLWEALEAQMSDLDAWRDYKSRVNTAHKPRARKPPAGT
jgi:hypothetical protein